MRDVDMISELLLSILKVEWRRTCRDNECNAKANPFVAFMKYLDSEREDVAGIAEVQVKRNNSEHHRNERRRRQAFHANKPGLKKYLKYAYPSHRRDTINHTTAECKEFLKLPITGTNGKYDFGNHKRQNCPGKVPCHCCGSNLHDHCCVFESQVLQTTSAKGSNARPTTPARRIRKQLPMPQEVNPWHCIPSTKQM